MLAAIATDHLTKRFGALTAVDALDLEVFPGEVFGFLGPNGAGKTTTIRLLLDILRPTVGTATVLGRPTSDVEVRRRIGFLPAELHLDRRHTVAQAIGFYGALRGGFPGGEVEALSSRFGLDPTRSIGELSTGNRRKLGVVVAFAGRPDVLILDEPSSGLNPLLQHELIALVEERVAGGATPRAPPQLVGRPLHLRRRARRAGRGGPGYGPGVDHRRFCRPRSQAGGRASHSGRGSPGRPSKP